MKKLLVIGILSALFYACHKEDNQINSKSASDYLPLKTGNYWIYQEFKIDSAGNEIDYPIFDSTVVSQTKVINNNTYYVIEEFGNYLDPNDPGKKISGVWWNWHYTRSLRDSSGYLVYPNGQILFAVDNFEDILCSYVEILGNDKLYTSTYKMEAENTAIEVPAGSFSDVLNFRGTYTTPVKLPGVPNPRYTNNLYAKNVGNIKETANYLHTNTGLGRKLVKYYVQK